MELRQHAAELRPRGCLMGERSNGERSREEEEAAGAGENDSSQDIVGRF